MADARALPDLLREMTDWIGLIEQPAYGTNGIYDEIVTNFVPRILAEVQPAAGLDVDLIQRVMFRLVGTSHVPDLDNGGVAFLAHREFAELFAAEYARLRGGER